MIIIHRNPPFWQGGIGLKLFRHKRLLTYGLLTAGILLIVIGSVLLAQTFRGYNELSLSRQDRQLEEMARTIDHNMASLLEGLQEDLIYVIGRRGFVEAEATWQQTGDAEELLSRMQENRLSTQTMVHAMLTIQGDTILLSSGGNTDYYFPSGMEGALQPCFAGDGSMYLALFADGQHARYAALVSMADWYAALTHIHASENIQLMLLGSQRKILLHTWMGEQHVSAVEELTEDSCDQSAVRCLMESRTTGQALTTSYDLSYPGDTYVHEMRMTTVPLEACENGYFIVGLICDYDEILLPMQAAAWYLFLSGVLLVTGLLLMVLMAVMLVRQSRRRDLELESLRQRSEETQKLLDKTTELAHHQRLETIGTLTASIAHEFNNLLTPIMGYAILTLEGLPEGCDDLADNAAEIYEASRKAKTIIARLNDLSRRNVEASFSPIALNGIVEKARQVAAPAQPPRVTTCFTPPAENILVSGNETQLSQLLLNLILNAYHAMEDSGGTLTLSLTREDDQAMLRVQDEGVGIPQEALPHIFDPFFTTKESGRGTGLGLAIVQQIVQSHHGEIDVISTPGKGTTFTLRLPLTNMRENTIS